MYETDVIIRNKKLWPIKSVFESWIKVNIEYMERYRYEDCLFWYNERSNVGSLAGAVWRLGGVALEEYSSAKMADTEKAEFSGRRDLYFDFNNNRYLCEAKIKWLKIGNKDESHLEEISKVMEQAVADTVASFKGGTAAEFGMAIVFVVPFFPKNKGEDTSEKREILHNSIIESDMLDSVSYLKLNDVNIFSKKYAYDRVYILTKCV